MSGNFTDDRVADAARDNWVDRYAPRFFRPYARLARYDRPIGYWLLFWPCVWGSALALAETGADGLNFYHIALFLIGAIAMRGAGCTYNDIVDRDLDKQVARTRSRPLASGAVSLKAAFIWLGLQCLIGLIVLLQFNLTTIIVGAASLLTIAIYPFMKRVTWWPQLFLGLSFGWGALVGYTATSATLSPVMLALYAATIALIIGYDTIYAHQDREDDAMIGVRSTARRFEKNAQGFIGLMYGVCLGLMAVSFALAGLPLPAYVGLLAYAAFFAWQLKSLDINDAGKCLAQFKQHSPASLLPLTGLIYVIYFT